MKKKRQTGWLAVALQGACVDLVHVKRGTVGRPQVTLCDSYGKTESDAATLSRLCKQLGLHRYRCTTLLRRENYQLQQIEAPNVPASELKAAVRWRIKDMISYPVESAIVDVLEIPHDSEAPAPEHALYAVAAPNDAVEKVTEPFVQARLSLDAIDIPELAQRNIAALYEADGSGVLMLGFFADESLLTFTRGGELYNARRIDIGLAQLTGTDAARRTTYYERIALELQRSFEHLSRNYHYVNDVRVLVAPLPSVLDLGQYLGFASGLPVESMDLATVLDFAAVPELKRAESQARYLASLGAALRDEHGLAA